MANSYKILVVEDNDLVRMQIVHILNGDGYTVFEAQDGESALPHIDENPDLAIVDVRMEPMGGFEFIRTIRRHEIDTPVILVTGDNDPDLLADASDLHVEAVLMKPVHKDRFLQTVSRTLDKKTAKQKKN